MTIILKTKSFANLQDRQEKFCQRAIYGMIDGSRNTIFSWWKTPNGGVKLKTVVSQVVGTPTGIGYLQ